MKWLPIPVFLPGEFHGQRSLAVYSPWGRKELDMLERLTLSLVVQWLWLCLPAQGVQVWSLDGELRSPMPQGVAKKKTQHSIVNQLYVNKKNFFRRYISTVKGISCRKRKLSILACFPSLRSRRFLLSLNKTFMSNMLKILPDHTVCMLQNLLSATGMPHENKQTEWLLCFYWGRWNLNNRVWRFLPF